jgi:putative transposase
MAERLRSQLVHAVLEMAYAQRAPRQVIHHSDHGTEYTAIGFSKRCTQFGVRPSRGSIGECFHNAMAESVFATLEARCGSKYLPDSRQGTFGHLLVDRRLV